MGNPGRKVPIVNRTALGWLVVGLLVAGGAMLAVPAWDDPFGGVLLRSGIVLGALWLALPRARELSKSTWAAIAVFSVVLIARPRLILWGFLVAVAMTLLGAMGRLDRRRKQKSTDG